MIYLDTHVVVWLCEARTEKLTPQGIAAIDGDAAAISPMVVLELAYLYEAKRTKVGAERMIQMLTDQIELVVDKQPFDRVAEQAIHETWTRDPFDRLIVAQAKLTQSRLLSKDRMIREHYRHAIW